MSVPQARPITTALLRRWPLPRLDPKRGKVSRGRVFVLGGSDANPGAVMLAATASLRAGAGTLVIATTERSASAMAVAIPEARVLGLRSSRRGELAAAAARTIQGDVAECGALVVGPGMMDGRAGSALLSYCMRARRPLTCVIDAAPLRALQSHKLQSVAPSLVLTPHAGEMASICGITSDEVLARPLVLARETAHRLGAVVILKGAVTYVVAPDGESYRSTVGNLGLGTSGSGDVLAGLVGGLCARGAEPLQAAVWAVHVHALAGDVLARRLGPLGYLASELLPEIPSLLLSGARGSKRPSRRP